MGQQVSHEYPVPGVYTVILVGSDTNSCNFADTAVVQVTIVDPPVVEASFQAQPTSDCQGFSVALFNTSTGAGQYAWSFGDGGSSTATNPTHAYTGPGEYEVTLVATDPLCGDSDSITQLITLDPPEIEVSLPDSAALCNGESIIMDAGPGFATYQWSTGATTQVITVTQPGTYSVVVTEGICVGNASTTVVVQTPPPAAADVTTCPGVPVVLQPPYPVTSIQWNTGDTVPSIPALESGDYWFIAVDQFGCTVQDTIAVTLLTATESGALVPNVFSPNGDGKNDTFLVQGAFLDDFEMEIYNRWGQVMFRSTNVTNGWNGGVDNQTSAKVPDGTYYYVISFKDRCSDEPRTERTGHVTVLR